MQYHVARDTRTEALRHAQQQFGVRASGSGDPGTTGAIVDREVVVVNEDHSVSRLFLGLPADPNCQSALLAWGPDKLTVLVHFVNIHGFFSVFQL